MNPELFIRRPVLTTLLMAGIMWTVQFAVIPMLRHTPAGAWPLVAATYWRGYQALFWPLLMVELTTGLLAPWWHPPADIPPWMHLANLLLLLLAWATIPGLRLATGHGSFAHADAKGFHRFARLHWARVIIWTVRGGIVIAMLQLAAAAPRA